MSAKAYSELSSADRKSYTWRAVPINTSWSSATYLSLGKPQLLAVYSNPFKVTIYLFFSFKGGTNLNMSCNMQMPITMCLCYLAFVISISLSLFSLSNLNFFNYISLPISLSVVLSLYEFLSPFIFNKNRGNVIKNLLLNEIFNNDANNMLFFKGCFKLVIL